MSDTHIAYSLAAAAALIWGLVVIFIKQAGIPGRLGVGVSLVTAATIMCALAGRDLRTLLELPVAGLGLVFLAGTVQFTMSVTLYFEAIRRGRLSVVVPITRLQILPLLGLSILFGLEQFGWGLLGVSLIVVAGSVLVGRTNDEDTTQERRDHLTSISLAVASCLAAAVGVTLFGMLPETLAPVTANAGVLTSGLVSYVIYALASGVWREFRGVPLRGWLNFAAHGALSLALAYVLFIRALQLAPPPRVMIVVTTYPLISALVGWLAYRERFRIATAVGGVLIIGGVMLLQTV